MKKQRENLGIIICVSVLCTFFFISLFTKNWHFLIAASPVAALFIYYVSVRMQNKQRWGQLPGVII